MGSSPASAACLLATLSLAVAAGCTGAVGNGSTTANGGAPNAGGTGPKPISDDPNEWEGQGNAADAPKLPLRLITKTEYDNTINLIFADEYGALAPGLRPGAVLPGETVDQSGFLAVGEVSEVHVLRQGEAAAMVTNAAAASLPKLLGCDIAKTTDDVACIRTFVSSFGLLLYRRPLADKEVQQHVAFYQEERSTLGQTAVAAALQLVNAMLVSPHFLYRWEDGWKVAERKGNVVRLNPYQVASRLAFLLWASGPDRELLALARDGGLNSPPQVEAQARKMLKSPRAERALDSFHGQWLGLAALDQMFKDKNRFPQWSVTLGTAMRQEVETFARNLVLTGDGTVDALLSSSFSYVNQDVAKVYGIASVSGDDFRKVELDTQQRAGLLTMPGLLAVAADASVANPFRRGKLVLEKILCRALEPPADIPLPPSFDPKDPRSERQVLEELTGAPACRGCHQELNAFGFGLGNFDAIGGFQTKDDAGKPVDASGKIPGTNTTFSGPAELAKALANHDEVRACLTKQWFRFALGRHEDNADTFSLGASYKAFAAQKFNVRELLSALVTTRSFLYRTLEANETVEVSR